MKIAEQIARQQSYDNNKKVTQLLKIMISMLKKKYYSAKINIAHYFFW
jgi:hypothetical protein